MSAHQRIAENNGIITDFQTSNLMERILHKDNLNKAYKKVKSDKAAGGIDGMSVDELPGFLKDNQRHLIQQIKDGKYKPDPVSRGVFEKTEAGMPQGGPINPLLSNRMLNEMDKELTRRVRRFVRYADDCMIFCKSRKGAERTLNNIMPYIEGKLFLKVNRTKTCVAHISKVKYLGYSFYRHKGKCRFRVHPKSVTKMKNKIRELTDKSNGWGNEYRALKLTQYIRGWVNYFGMAVMKSLLQSNDEWLLNVGVLV